MRNKSILGSLALAAILAASASTFMASDLQAQVGVQIKVTKVYDRDHKDYHVWNANEDKAYRGYLVENHREYVVYGRQKRVDQTNYWKWRHEHPDHDEHR